MQTPMAESFLPFNFSIKPQAIWRAARHLDWSAVRLARDLPGGERTRGHRHGRQPASDPKQPAQGDSLHYPRAARRADPQAPADGLRQDGPGLWRRLHRLHLPRPHPATGERFRCQCGEPDPAGVRGVGGGRQYLGRQAGGQDGPAARAEADVWRPGTHPADAHLHGAPPCAGGADSAGVGCLCVWQRAGPAGAGGETGRAPYPERRGCGLRPQHRRL